MKAFEGKHMEYIKIRADFKYAEKGRLYRVFLVPKGIGLFEMGCHIVSVFQGALEHCFLYTHGRVEFVQAPFLETDFPGVKSLWMGQYTVEDLPETFEFEYDTGDGWYFKCKKYRKTVQADYDGDPRIVVLEGAGQGIWEDNIGTLYSYFEGQLDPNAKAEQYEDDEKAYYLPWNVSVEKWGDYDAPLDPSMFECMEDVAWPEAWERELEYAREMGLDKIKKDPDPFFHCDSDLLIRNSYLRLLGETLPYAFGREEIIKKAEETYGKSIGRKRFLDAFEEEITKVLDEETLDKLFKAIGERIDE